MRYRVVVLPSVEEQIDSYINYIACTRHEPINAQKVLSQIRQSVDRIEVFPNAAPYAPENDYRPYTIRMPVVAGCQLIFTIDEDAKTVRVIGFRHNRQMPDSGQLPEQ